MRRRFRTLRRGLRLYHGTAAIEDFEIPTGPAWFSNSIDVARWFVRYHDPGGTPRVLVYRLARPIRLPVIDETKDFARWLADDPDDFSCDTAEAAEAFCCKYEGWVIPANYPEGADVLICTPSEYLELIQVLAVDTKNT